MRWGVPFLVLALAAWIATTGAAAQALLSAGATQSVWFIYAGWSAAIWLVVHLLGVGWAATMARTDPTSLGWLPPFMDLLKWSFTCFLFPGVGIVLSIALLAARDKPELDDKEVLTHAHDLPMRSYAARLAGSSRKLFAGYLLAGSVVTHAALIALLVQQ